MALFCLIMSGTPVGVTLKAGARASLFTSKIFLHSYVWHLEWDGEGEGEKEKRQWERERERELL